MWRGVRAPSASASTGRNSLTRAGSSSTMLYTPGSPRSIGATVASARGSRGGEGPPPAPSAPARAHRRVGGRLDVDERPPAPAASDHREAALGDVLDHVAAPREAGARA